MGFLAWLFNLNTPRIAAPEETKPAKVSPVKRRRRVRKIGRARAVPVKVEDVEEELAVAMVEKMVEEDEKAAAAATAAAASQDSVSGPGYAMIALQEQLMLLKAQVEAIQKSAVEEPVSVPLSPSSFSPPPPVPPRDDELVLEDFVPQLPESEEVSCPAAPPPPEPFKTPGIRRFSAQQDQLPEQPLKEAAPLSELIREKSRSALKGTGVPRSPGGTPLRRHSANQSSPRGLLSSALNRKFRSVRLPESPVAKSAAAAAASDEEWENSPMEN